MGGGPTALGVDQNESTVYVANQFNDSISVISINNNTKIKDIPVGRGPTAINVYFFTNTVYIANGISEGVTVIDALANEALAKIKFNIYPPNSGNIICSNNLTAPLNSYFYVPSSTGCEASPNKGFGFLSWVENLNNNSTRTIKRPRDHNSIEESILDLLGYKPNDPNATLNVTQYGNFVANFKELPTLPPEYWGTLFSVIVAALIGTWLMPSIFGWTKSKRQHRRLRRYWKRMDSLRNSKPGNQNGRDTVDILKDDLTTAYSNGKINELQYEVVKEAISKYEREKISETISSLKSASKLKSSDYFRKMDESNKLLNDAYSDGKISTESYMNFKNEISVLYEEAYDKQINSLVGKSNEDNSLPLSKIQNELMNAYVKGSISDLHYNLLNRKISEFEINKRDRSETYEYKD